jgi:acetylornithine deacetylase/succinyl-diaminopimelate desuccinylase-like protein
MNAERTRSYIAELWGDSIVPELIEYIRIPNKSPAFDPDWQKNGYMEEAVGRFERWACAQNIAGMQLDIIGLPGRTPLMFMDIPGESRDSVLLYGHLDKQPEMSGWREGLGPWQPVLEGDRLYGRGGADDGYALFASLSAIAALKAQGLAHARCVVIIEACEESGSFDLPFYIAALADRIGNPSLVICLDSGCGNYDQLWSTTSLRGLAGGILDVRILTEGVHSGDASGIVPSSFRILRQLLSRLESETSGAILDSSFHAEIPAQRLAQAEAAARTLGSAVFSKFPFCEGASPVSVDPRELILNRTWRPALSVVGAGGLPTLESAGNVLRPGSAVKLSLRLPPTCDARAAAEKLKRLLEADPPYGATVRFTPDWAASGWEAPAVASWLEGSVDRASRNYFGQPAVYMGEGGSIPFMGMLGERFPRAQFLITGVLGPHSNAHGPNEFLHLPTAQKLSACVAQVLADHCVRQE